MPPTVLRLLQETGSVQLLDSGANRHCMAIIVDLVMNDTAEAGLVDLFPCKTPATAGGDRRRANRAAAPPRAPEHTTL